MKNGFCILLTIFFIFTHNKQTGYENLCIKIKEMSFSNQFNHQKIELKVKKLISIMGSLTREEFESCNCADTMWIALLHDKRNFYSYTHSIKLDTHSYLRELPSRIDIENLNQEFRFAHLYTLHDSLNYVLSRLKKKEDKRNISEYNWQNFYHCIEAEVQFLNENKYKLKEYYFRIFDDTSYTKDIRDIVLASFFNSDEAIEFEILNRIGNYKDQNFFYRMLGILSTSGTEKSVNYLVKSLKENKYNLNDKKIILQVIYELIDRKKIQKESRINFEKYLRETQLDTLSRYELYLRDN